LVQEQRSVRIKFDNNKEPLSQYFDLMGVAFENHLPLSPDEICKYKNACALLAAINNPKEQEHSRH